MSPPELVSSPRVTAVAAHAGVAGVDSGATIATLLTMTAAVRALQGEGGMASGRGSRSWSTLRARLPGCLPMRSPAPPGFPRTASPGGRAWPMVRANSMARWSMPMPA